MVPLELTEENLKKLVSMDEPRERSIYLCYLALAEQYARTRFQGRAKKVGFRPHRYARPFDSVPGLTTGFDGEESTDFLEKKKMRQRGSSRKDEKKTLSTIPSDAECVETLGNLSQDDSDLDDATAGLVAQNTIHYPWHGVTPTAKKLRNFIAAYRGWVGGPRIVFDTWFSPQLSETERSLSAVQVVTSFHRNRWSRLPADLTIVNRKSECSFWTQCVPKILRQEHVPEDSLDVWSTEKSLTELYDPSEVVVLSPDSPNVAGPDFDWSKRLVIGAVVDKLFPRKNLTKDYAASIGVETVRLPLVENLP